MCTLFVVSVVTDSNVSHAVSKESLSIKKITTLWFS